MIYSRDIAERICAGLAEGKTLRAVCRGEGMPSHATVLNWRKINVDGFKARYEEARQIGYELWADECIELADDSGIEPGEVQKARLRFDARRWALSKALPKIYGDKLTHTGSEEAPIVTEVVYRWATPAAAEELKK